MTVKELASKMNELFREEKGDYQIRVSVDSIAISYPINDEIVKIFEPVNIVILQVKY